MAHRTERDRDPIRDRDRERDRPRRDRERDPRDRPERESARLNEYFVNGEGIHREVMQREICKYLGPEAYSRPGTHNGATGFIVTAVRPFTQKMIDDLVLLSEDFILENRDLSRKGYEGVPYTQSQTSRRSDRSESGFMSPPDPSYGGGDRYLHQPTYSSAAGQPGYTTTAGYPQVSNYPPSQIPGYSSSQGYPPVSGYPPAPSYSSGTTYPSGSSYPTSSAYPAPVYPAPGGRSGVMTDQNYTYDAGEYSNPNYQYGRQQPSYAGAPRPGDPRTDPRVDPRSASAYPFVTSPPDVSMRGVPAEPRYDTYGQPITSTQASRTGFPAPSRGTPTGVYDPQPMDGGYRAEPVPEGRRRR